MPGTVCCDALITTRTHQRPSWYTCAGCGFPVDAEARRVPAVGVWDVRKGRPEAGAVAAWAVEHLPDRAREVFRVVFFAAGPSALIQEYATRGGRRYFDEATGEPAVAAARLILLSELPPAELLALGDDDS